MSGWLANGSTSPYFRSCHHQPINGRCVKCRAVEIPEYQQQGRPKGVVTGYALGSPELVPPKVFELNAITAGSGAVAPKTWNGTFKRKEAA